MFQSTLSTAVSIQPLNYVHISTSPTTKKERKPYLQGCPVAWSCKHVKHVVCLLSITEKRRCCRGFQLRKPWWNWKKGDAQYSGRLLQHIDSDNDKWDLKKGQQFTLLRRITRLKTVNSDVVLLSTVSLERLSPKGSYHLDGTGMSDTLNQKHLSELLVWNASFVHKQSSKNDRFVWEIWGEKPPWRNFLWPCSMRLKVQKFSEFWCSSNSKNEGISRLRQQCSVEIKPTCRFLA